MAKEFKYYVADDGKKFDSLEACEEYERKVIEESKTKLIRFKKKLEDAFHIPMDEQGTFVINLHIINDVKNIEFKCDDRVIYGKLNDIVNTITSVIDNNSIYIKNITRLVPISCDDLYKELIRYDK